MRMFLVGIIGVLIFINATAHTAPQKSILPAWSLFRVQTDKIRKQVEENILIILEEIEKKPISINGKQVCVLGAALSFAKDKCSLKSSVCDSQKVECSHFWSDKTCIDKPESLKSGTTTRLCANQRLKFPVTSREFVFSWFEFNSAVTGYCKSQSKAKIGIEACEKLKSIKSEMKMISSPAMEKISYRFKFRNSALGYMLNGLIENQVLAEEKCEIKDQILVTPSGRKIYLDYGRHSIGDELDSLYDAMANEESPDKLKAIAQKIIDENKSAIDERKKRAQNIKSFLADNSVEWLGVEATEQELLNPASRITQNSYLSQRIISSGLSDEEYDRILASSSAYGGVGYLWDSDPKVQKRLTLTPLEDKVAKQDATSIAQFDGENYARFQLMVKQKLISESERKLIESRYMSAVYGASPMTKAEIAEFSSQFSNSSVAEMVQNLLQGIRALKLSSQEREDAVVRSVWVQRGNGVISFGEAHRASLDAKLKAACELELSRSHNSDPKVFHSENPTAY